MPDLMRRLTWLFMIGVVSAGPVLAGEFYEPNGVAIGGVDPVAYLTERKAVMGSSRFTVLYRGSLFHFASAEHRDAFLADPIRFAPQYGGFCAYGTAKGYKAKSEPEAFTIVGGKLYLNYNLGVRKRWQAGLPDVITAGDRQWPAVSQLSHVTQ